MKRVLLTGATGFVGANLAWKLLEAGHEVHILVRGSQNIWRIETILGRLNVHIVDLSDKDSVALEVRNIQPNWIFHLATYGAYAWQDDLMQAIRTNYVGTVNLLEACLECGFEVFVNTGTCSEYGAKDFAVTEGERLEPDSYYAVTKAATTLYCRYAAQRAKFPIFTLRLYSVYGAFEDPKRLMPQIIVNGINGRLPMLGNPNITKDFIHIDNVSAAYLSIAEKGVKMGF